MVLDRHYYKFFERHCRINLWHRFDDRAGAQERRWYHYNMGYIFYCSSRPHRKLFAIPRVFTTTDGVNTRELEAIKFKINSSRVRPPHRPRVALALAVAQGQP